jgi:hypothetical protein
MTGSGLDLINTSFTITLNHNQFTTVHNRSSAKPFDCRGLAPFSFSFYDFSELASQYTDSGRTSRIGPLPRTGHGTGHVENIFSNTFFFTVACAYFGRCLEMGLRVTIQKYNFVVLYGCETRSLILREEYRLRVLENNILLVCHAGYLFLVPGMTIIYIYNA